MWALVFQQSVDKFEIPLSLTSLLLGEYGEALLVFHEEI